MMMKKLEDWSLAAVLQYQPFYSPHVRRGSMLSGETPWIPAKVPGSVYRDLIAAGLLEDPYYGLNSLSCEWVANRWWCYKTTFTLSEAEMESPLAVCFEGIDYKAHVYVNGEEIGAFEGMYRPYEAEITAALKPAGEENVLICVLENAPQADPQGGFCSRTRYLKARYNYRWDFCARLVNLGLYGSVYIRSIPEVRFAYAQALPMKDGERWQLLVRGETAAKREIPAMVSLEANVEGARVSAQWPVKAIDGHTAFSFRVPLPESCQPGLWQPNGLGEQPLYPAAISISADGVVMDKKSLRIGFRTLAYRCADGREDALPYNVVVNGRRVYLKGSNYVPADCMTGDDAHVRDTVLAAKAANINYFRIWGGGHMESEAFYNACDECGIMVLQEMPMSSAGCDDVPSRDPMFLAMLADTARYNMRRLANHPSLILFDGGNELTDDRYEGKGRSDHEAHPVTLSDPTIAMLSGIASECAPGILFLPASASGPRALLDPRDRGNNHDVHGPWHYAGVKGHYELFNASDSIVHGEFGCGGMAGIEQLARVLPENERHVQTNRESRVWAHHSSGWDTYERREKALFGDVKGLQLADYVKLSQFMQWEALRYALEANRRRLWKNVGEMTWQFNEPWPNVQCSNVLEYYGGRKLAFYALKEAYRPVLTSLSYDSIAVSDRLNAGVFFTVEGEGGEYAVRVSAADERGKLLFEKSFAGTISGDSSAHIGEISIKLPEDFGRSVLVTCETRIREKETAKNYLFLKPDENGLLDIHAVIRFWESEMKKNADI